jgi:uncharacterized protein YndB with AHSA1/START domain
VRLACQHMAGHTYTVERAATIDAPAERIYVQIADFRRRRAWSPWEDLDPNLQRTYSGAEAGAGAVYAWSGNRKAGQGRMEITDASAPSRVDIDLVFEEPWKAHNTTVCSIRPSGEGSQVAWTMTGPKTLMTKAMGIFTSMDKVVGKDFEKGLARLRAVAERPAT